MTRTSTGKPKHPAQRDFDWDALLASAENGTIDLTCPESQSSRTPSSTASNKSLRQYSSLSTARVRKDKSNGNPKPRQEPYLPNQKRKRSRETHPSQPDQPLRNHRSSGTPAHPPRPDTESSARASPVSVPRRQRTVRTTAQDTATVTASTSTKVRKNGKKGSAGSSSNKRNVDKPSPGNHLIDALQFYHSTGGQLPHHIFKNRDEGFRKIFQIHTRSNLHHTTL